MYEPGKHAQLRSITYNPTAAWDQIFQAKGFITSPGLGKPGTQLYYNIYATETREKNVDMLCKAEANLD